MSRRKRYATYAGFLLLGAVVTFAGYESARLTEEMGNARTGERGFEVQEAGAGPIYTAHGDVVEGRCSFVRAPGGLFYFDPENPETTACVHPPRVVHGAPSSRAVVWHVCPEHTATAPGSVGDELRRTEAARTSEKATTVQPTGAYARPKI